MTILLYNNTHKTSPYIMNLININIHFNSNESINQMQQFHKFIT